MKQEQLQGPKADPEEIKLHHLILFGLEPKQQYQMI